MALAAKYRFVRRVAIAFCLCVVAAFAYSQYSLRIIKPRNLPPLSQAPQGSRLAANDDYQDPRCAAFPDPGNIAIAVKTGATEAVEKIPVMIKSTLPCAKSVMIFSDLEQEVAGHHIHDALEDIPASVMQGNTDFDFYLKLKLAKSFGHIKKMMGHVRNPQNQNDLAAWTLDKYKNLPAFERLYAAHPDKDWYFMMDADTFIVWSNFLTWLSKIPDPVTKPWYLGARMYINNNPFAQGGTGILISQAAMKNFITKEGESAGARWHNRTAKECCGDLMVALMLEKESGIDVKQSWPTMNSNDPSTLMFGPDVWCQPVVTMHHVTPSDMNRLANFEQSRPQTKTPLTFSDVFDAFTKDVLPESLDNWDGNCDNAVAASSSFEQCQISCQAEDKCFQFSFDGKDCRHSHSFHLGEPKQPNGSMRWKSGWMKDRIDTWVKKQPTCRPKFPWT